MKYNTTTYKIKDKTVSKINIRENCWIMIYDKSINSIIVKPTMISNLILETIDDFYIGNSEEELDNVINNLGLIDSSEESSIVSKAINEIKNYTLL